MITTRNRCEDLRRTLARLGGMQPPPDEVLVTADGCADDTAAMVRKEFPAVCLRINEPGLGSVPSRDVMLKQARGEIVLCLDDDSYPEDGDFFAKLPQAFAEHPEAMVLSFPEERDGGVFYPESKSPDSPGHYVSAYLNGAAAMLRDPYLEGPGYPAFFTHAYEEPDYAVQCYARRRAVWFLPSVVIRHHRSPKNRDRLQTHHFNARNELWSVWMRCPWPWVPLVSLFRVWRQFCHAARQGGHWMLREPLWWWSAVKGVCVCLRHRSPVEWPIYFGWMRLARLKVTTREELERLLRRELICRR
ncbi:MAG: glycosyltransferase [Verrucomicrobiota bacterium]